MTRFGIEGLQKQVQAAVDAEGMRPFARRAGVGVGVVRSMLEGRDPSFSSAEALARALGLDLGFGSVAPLPSPPEPSSRLFAQVPLHEAMLAAGLGVENGSEHIIDYLAFRRDWLRKIGLSPPNAVLVRAKGESMQPTIQPDDLVMIDRARNTVPIRPRAPNDRRPSSIYALLHEGQARIKRIERPEEALMMLISDNPAYGPEVLTGAKIEALNIIGKVMWWGHTNRE